MSSHSQQNKYLWIVLIVSVPSHKFNLLSPSTGSAHSYVQLQEERQQLPIYSARKKLLQQVQRLASAIVIGETGSGKTTQIPQVGAGQCWVQWLMSRTLVTADKSWYCIC